MIENFEVLMFTREIQQLQKEYELCSDNELRQEIAEDIALLKEALRINEKLE
ncbi:hypothetical protein [Peribacillus sp. SCS-155]|uniref:hypothetical protein n=1 Tax=Peribacillus sedimenti TaxID=3115297 RepID=UPI003906299A